MTLFFAQRCDDMLCSMEAGRTRPVKEFLAELREEFGFPESRPDKQ
jgi:hypothetical protein